MYFEPALSSTSGDQSDSDADEGDADPGGWGEFLLQENRCADHEQSRVHSLNGNQLAEVPFGKESQPQEKPEGETEDAEGEISANFRNIAREHVHGIHGVFQQELSHDKEQLADNRKRDPQGSHSFASAVVAGRMIARI